MMSRNQLDLWPSENSIQEDFSLVPNHKLRLLADAHRADGDVESGEQLAHADPGHQVSEVTNEFPFVSLYT